MNDFTDRDQMLTYLKRDGGRVPCSRYGDDSVDCAPFAIACAEIAQEANGDPITTDNLDYYMGLVVNNSDSVEELIREHGNAEQYKLIADLYTYEEMEVENYGNDYYGATAEDRCEIVED